jgi:tetratricopeptide (TPR) repeat protein
VQAASGRSGIVRAERGKLRRLFCLERGALVFAASNLVEEQFGEYLVRRRILSPSLRASLVARASTEGKKLGEILLDSPELDATVLRDAAESLATELLSSTLEWPDGSARFDAGLPRLDGEIVFRLAPVELIFDHCRRYPVSPDAVRLRLGPPDVRPGRTAEADSILDGVELPRDVLALLARCDGATPLPVLVDGSGDANAALRTLYALMLAGVLEPVRQKVRVASDAPLSREECEGRLAAASSGDLYAVLGVSRDASPDSIRSAYYSIARRYHPDRFRAGDLQDLLPRFEAFFASVTEAHNTLGDATRRAEYDQSSQVGAADAQRTDTADVARQNYLRGRALASQRKFNDALSFLENAVRQDERRPEYRLELGLVLARNPRRKSEAEAHLLSAAELAPSLAGAYRGLGEIYLRAGLRPAGCRLLREAIKWDPDDADAAGLLAGAEAEGRVPDEPGPLLRRRFSD